MIYYFELQGLRLKRWAREVGVHPLIACCLLLMVFAVGSVLLLTNLSYGSWIYALVAVYLSSTTQYTALPRLLFSRAHFHVIRLLSSLMLVLPFVVVLFLNQSYLEGLVVILAGPLGALLTMPSGEALVIPTPFYRHPFEFIAGFRNSWAALSLVYGVSVMALWVGNLNLGLFAMAAVCLITLGYYTKPEPETYLSIFAMTSGQFLRYKVRLAILQTYLLVCPLALALCEGFWQHWLVIVLLFAAGPVLPVIGLLQKYAYFPKSAALLSALLLSFCIALPPLLLLLLPYLAHKALVNLRNQL